MLRIYNIALLVLSLLVISYSSAAIVGTAMIRAPAVILYNNTGSLTNVSLVITNGTGKVNVTGAATIGQSTVQSADTAAKYASQFTNHNFSKYNFNYTFNNAGSNVSGPSAGAAMTILAISAFTNQQIRNDFTMTGTINLNGTIGEIGGVYDKVNASKNAGAKLVLVPKVNPSTQEDELYFLVQTNFDIPLVQVVNISQAATFAFNPQLNGIANETNYSFYTNYSVDSLPNPELQCIGPCNDTLFKELLNATFKLNNDEISSLNSNKKFSRISDQLQMQLNQSMQLSNRSYIYTAADFAFLNYVNAFYINGYSANRESGLELLNKVANTCYSISPPPLTRSNYNYVISAELRQGWGNFTINSTLQAYNISQIDSDQILQSLYLGAQANGWCKAASLIYNESTPSPNASDYVVPSTILKNIALQKIDNDAKYGNSLYFQSAKIAYTQSNYPVAILDADYAYSFGNASDSFGLSTQELNNKTLSIINNPSYGIWASEFSKQALFYESESKLSTNASTAKTYAESAYSVALLSSYLGNDTSLISSNLVNASAQQIQEIQNNTSNSKLLAYLENSQIIILVLLVIIFALLIFVIILLLVLMHKIDDVQQGNRKKQRK